MPNVLEFAGKHEEKEFKREGTPVYKVLFPSWELSGAGQRPWHKGTTELGPESARGCLGVHSQCPASRAPLHPKPFHDSVIP